MHDEIFSEEFYEMFGNKELLVIKTPPDFRELRQGDYIRIVNSGIIGEHITNEQSYVDIEHGPGLPRLSPEGFKLLPKDFPSEDKYYQEIESRKFLGKTNWMLYSMYEAISNGYLVFAEKHKRNKRLFMSFVEAFFDGDELDN